MGVDDVWTAGGGRGWEVEVYVVCTFSGHVCYMRRFFVGYRVGMASRAGQRVGVGGCDRGDEVALSSVSDAFVRRN